MHDPKSPDAPASPSGYEGGYRRYLQQLSVDVGDALHRARYLKPLLQGGRSFQSDHAVLGLDGHPVLASRRVGGEGDSHAGGEGPVADGLL